jgi:hypothetical protein
MYPMLDRLLLKFLRGKTTLKCYRNWLPSGHNVACFAADQFSRIGGDACDEMEARRQERRRAEKRFVAIAIATHTAKNLLFFFLPFFRGAYRTRH